MNKQTNEAGIKHCCGFSARFILFVVRAYFSAHGIHSIFSNLVPAVFARKASSTSTTEKLYSAMETWEKDSKKV